MGMMQLLIASRQLIAHIIQLGKLRQGESKEQAVSSLQTGRATGAPAPLQRGKAVPIMLLSDPFDHCITLIGKGHVCWFSASSMHGDALLCAVAVAVPHTQQRSRRDESFSQWWHSRNLLFTF